MNKYILQILNLFSHRTRYGGGEGVESSLKFIRRGEREVQHQITQV